MTQHNISSFKEFLDETSADKAKKFKADVLAKNADETDDSPKSLGNMSDKRHDLRFKSFRRASKIIRKDKTDKILASRT